MLILPTVSGSAPTPWHKYAIARHSPACDAPGAPRPAIGAARSSGSVPIASGRRVSGPQANAAAGASRRPSGGSPAASPTGADLPALPVRPPSGSGRRAAVSSRTPASSGAYPPVGTGGGRGSGSMPVVGGLGGSGIYSSHRGPILGPSDELPDVPPAPKAPAHYDLFFEMEPGDEEHRGLLHFATLDDQPPIGDGELLRLGEMHRRRYLSYEGPVDQERGAVRIVDRGSFRWMPQSDPAAGHFWLFIDGGLLNGIFTISVLPAQLVQVGSEFRFQFQFSEFPA